MNFTKSKKIRIRDPDLKSYNFSFLGYDKALKNSKKQFGFYTYCIDSTKDNIISQREK